MATESEYAAGAAALQSYIDGMLQAAGKSWEEGFIPSSVFVAGAKDAIDAADQASLTDTTVRETAAATALRIAVDQTGQGDQVSDQDCANGAIAILVAVANYRNPPPAAA